MTVRYLISNLFPKENYPPTEKKEGLHYLIALNQSIKAIAKWLESQPLDRLSYRSTNHLSPLDLCAYLDRRDVAQLLIDKGASVSEPDPMGRTPLHHACMLRGGTSPMVALLSSALKAGQSAEKILFGSDPRYLHLNKMLERPLPAPSSVVFQYKNSEGKIVSGTAAEYQKMTGSTYCDRVLAKGDNLIVEWLSPLPIPNQKDPSFVYFQQILRASYGEFLKKPKPKIYLGTDKNQPKVGFRVYAGETIQRGRIIGIYAGEQVVQPPGTINLYQMANTNGEKINNLMGRINHAFPNVAPFGLTDIDGFTLIEIVIAIEDIHEGDEICMNYGFSHPIVRSKDRVELRKEALHDFFKQNLILFFGDLLKKNKNLLECKTLNELLEKEGEPSKLCYLVHDPFAFRQMVDYYSKDPNFLMNFSNLLKEGEFMQMTSLDTTYTLSLITLCTETFKTGSINEKLFESVVALTQFKTREKK